jgi:hypothetical protein
MIPGEQVRDHHHVDQPEHAEHDLRLADLLAGDDVQDVHHLLPELHDIDAHRQDQPEVERQLQPAGRENHGRDGAEARGRGGRWRHRRWVWAARKGAILAPALCGAGRARGISRRVTDLAQCSTAARHDPKRDTASRE